MCVPHFDNRWILKPRARPGELHLAFTAGGKRIAYAYIRKNGCSAFKKLLGFHPATDISKVARANPYRPGRYDAVIFVWRDPEERLLSLYRSKVLERRDAADILTVYERVMGKPPGSFEDFARFATLNVDPHCWPQRAHLKRLRYTHAIPLGRLHEAMSDLVGPEAAEVFVQPTNASQPHPVEVTEEARRLIRNHYAADYRMIRRLKTEELRLR